MIGHDAALDLAAIALDFPISMDERAALDGHLAVCAVCRRRAAALRDDAGRIEALPVRAMTRQRGEEILGSVFSRTAPTAQAVRLALVAALIALLAVGAAVVGAGLLRSPHDDLSVIRPVPTPLDVAPPVDLAVGAEALTLTGDLRVRSQPRVADDSVKYEPLLGKGTRLRVLDGPVQASGYWWYRVAPYTTKNGQAVSIDLSGGATDGWVASAARDGTRWIAAFDPFLLLAWRDLGSIPAVVSDVVGFSKGYVAIEASASHVWFSPDGRSWRPVELPGGVDTTGARVGGEAWGVTSDGERVLVVGGSVHTPCVDLPGDSSGVTGDARCGAGAAAWLSIDGVTWRRSGPISMIEDGAKLIASWPVPTGGWDATASSGGTLGGPGLLHSDDGLAWSPLPDSPPLDAGRALVRQAGIADPSGRRLLWVVSTELDPVSTGASSADPRGAPVTAVSTSPDGRAWTAAPRFDGRNAEVAGGLSVDGGWLLGGSTGPASDWPGTRVPTLWRWGEGADPWELTELRRETATGVPVTDLLRSSLGYLVVGSSEAPGAVTHETWLSSDGRDWIELPASAAPGTDYGPRMVAEGPAGVIGISRSPATSGSKDAVWQLR